ncbi:MAG: hypothetical protein JEZ09_07495 [Salinivirgaceae bacterium]|nr:hypothetical protein [Salinivirgaceae bacterium]
MRKRPGFIVTILIFIISIGGFYIYLKQQQSPLTQPIHAIPLNTSMFIEFKNPMGFLEKINGNNSFTQKLREFPEIMEKANELRFIDSIINSDEVLKTHIRDKKILLSIHEIGKNKFERLYLTKLSGKFEANQILKTLSNNVIAKYSNSHSRYNQVKIFAVQGKLKSFYYCFHRGVLMGSSSELLIKDAIRQVENPNGLQLNADFNHLLKTAGDNVDANIYIQLKEANNLLAKVVSLKNLKDKSLSHIGNWVELDVNLKNNTLLLNGFNATTETNDFQSLFDGQNPSTMKFAKFTPVGVNSTLAFGLSDYNKYKESFRKFMEKTGQTDRYLINKKTFIETFGQNAETRLSEIFKNELAQVELADGNYLFYVKVKGYRDGQELVQNWINHYAKKIGQSSSAFKNSYKLDAESEFPIYTLPIEFIPLRLFGPWFKECSAKYVAVFDDYLIFSSNYKALTRTIYDNILQKTLSYNSAYNNYADFISTKVNMHAFISLESMHNSLETFLTPEAFNYFKKNEVILKDFYGLTWQFSSESNLIYNNLLVRNQPSKTLKAATVWEARLDTLVAFKPQLLVNHYTNEKEILIQDLKNNIYLINNTGRIIWKKQIDEPILGEVHQVDYFKNGKLQILFNTKAKLYLFDRNGNFVERYPIKLSSETNQPLALFDYDNRKNYRIFIGGIDRKIQVYSIKGKTVTGFNFNATDNNIIAPMQYFRSNNKDYLLVTDSSRIYILNRRGDSRIKLKKQFKPSPNNLFVFQAGNNTRNDRLIRTDIHGNVNFIYFNGDVETKQINDFSKNHFFEIVDVTGDNIYDFIYIDANELSVFNLSGKKQFTHKFDSKIEHSPAIYKFSSNKIYIGVTETQKRHVYLFDGKGQIIEGFPLLGKTKFSIGFLDKNSPTFNLVVGGDDQYLYNYKLN